MDSETSDNLPVCPPSTDAPEFQDLAGHGWQEYEGWPSVFHCGFDGIKEIELPDPTANDLQQECFYDEQGQLVDETHEYAYCAGTPNQYDASESMWDHTFNDQGGIASSAAWDGLGESIDYQYDQVKTAVSGFWDDSADTTQEPNSSSVTSDAWQSEALDACPEIEWNYPDPSTTQWDIPDTSEIDWDMPEPQFNDVETTFSDVDYYDSSNDADFDVDVDSLD